ncbi:MAG: sulfite exporter TauE/SafE family protein [Saprospiraceae bacterium]
MFLLTAFTIGLFGSLHCVGMCGPIALAVGGQCSVVGIRPLLLYNLGRTFTYSVLGLLIGLIGKGLFIAGLQQSLSIVVGIMLLAVALFSINVEQKIVNIPFMARLLFSLKSGMGRWLKKRGGAGSFMVGTFNGLLPCGLVYMAMVGALSTGNWWSGAAYMALFGLGTFPLMLLTGLAGHQISLKARAFLQKAYPIFLVLFALLFIFRGMNFQVPGDFFFLEKMGEMPLCH